MRRSSAGSTTRSSGRPIAWSGKTFDFEPERDEPTGSGIVKTGVIVAPDQDEASVRGERHRAELGRIELDLSQDLPRSCVLEPEEIRGVGEHEVIGESQAPIPGQREGLDVLPRKLAKGLPRAEVDDSCFLVPTTDQGTATVREQPG